MNTPFSQSGRNLLHVSNPSNRLPLKGKSRARQHHVQTSCLFNDIKGKFLLLQMGLNAFALRRRRRAVNVTGATVCNGSSDSVEGSARETLAS